MKMDKYTKVVLSVIAVCLMLLVIENGIPSAHAVSGVSKVAICDKTGQFCAEILHSRDGEMTQGLSVFTQ